MRHARLLLPLAFLGAACIVVPSSERPALNTLTSSERSHGVQLLFDGVSTAGWRGYRKEAFPEGWRVVDGALVRTTGGGDIVTVDEYSDFVLEFEWRLAPGANSGVMFRVTEDHDAPWETGPEYQLLDNRGHGDGLDPRTSAGANYAMHAPLVDVSRPWGEWNHTRIYVCGPYVEHWLNGQKIVEYELWSEDWERRVQACKWSERPDYGRRQRGRIVLQDHGDVVAYRNIKIQRLDPPH